VRALLLVNFETCWEGAHTVTMGACMFVMLLTHTHIHTGTYYLRIHIYTHRHTHTQHNTTHTAHTRIHKHTQVHEQARLMAANEALRKNLIEAQDTSAQDEKERETWQ